MINGNWQTITFTFQPYTPPVAPGAFPLGALTTPNNYLDFIYVRAVPVDPPAAIPVLGLYGPDGVLVTRLQMLNGGQIRVDTTSLAPGRYYLASGDDTTEFQNRFLVQDFQDNEIFSGSLRIQNGAGQELYEEIGVSSPTSSGRIDWNTFEIIPAPGAGVLLVASCGVIATRRRRR